MEKMILTMILSTFQGESGIFCLDIIYIIYLFLQTLLKNQQRSYGESGLDQM